MLINESPLDRALRGALGLALLAAPLVGFAIAPWNLLGLIPIVTALVGYCPLYALLGTSTCTARSYQHRREGIVLRETEEGGSGRQSPLTT